MWRHECMAGKVLALFMSSGGGNPRNLAAGSWAEHIRFPIRRTDTSSPSPYRGMCHKENYLRSCSSHIVSRIFPPPSHGCPTAACNFVTCSAEPCP
jgi:hypothetical protein